MGSRGTKRRSAELARAPFSRAVDVHHHIVPAFYRKALAAAGRAQSIAGVDFPEWDVDVSLRMMDRQGIETAVVSVSVPGVSVRDRGLAVRVARETNEFMAGLVSDHPARFGGFALLPPDTEGMLAEVAYALDKLRLDGIGLFTNYNGVYIGDAAFEPVWQELDQRRARVFLHPTVPPGHDLPLFGLPASVCEFPFETTRAVAQLLFNGTLDRYPGVRLILAHAGGAVPYLAERLTFAPTIDPSLKEREPVDLIGTLQRLYYDVAMSASAYALPSLRAFADVSQILVGTDFPFMPEASTAVNGAQLLKYGGFAAAELAQVTRENAVSLLPRLARVDSADGSTSKPHGTGRPTHQDGSSTTSGESR